MVEHHFPKKTTTLFLCLGWEMMPDPFAIDLIMGLYLKKRLSLLAAVTYFYFYFLNIRP